MPSKTVNEQAIKVVERLGITSSHCCSIATDITLPAALSVTSLLPSPMSNPSMFGCPYDHSACLLG
jgi:hypothetical protein